MAAYGTLAVWFGVHEAAGWPALVLTRNTVFASPPKNPVSCSQSMLLFGFVGARMSPVLELSTKALLLCWDDEKSNRGTMPEFVTGLIMKRCCPNFNGVLPSNLVRDGMASLASYMSSGISAKAWGDFAKQDTSKRVANAPTDVKVPAEEHV